jgi:hypothetical protein
VSIKVTPTQKKIEGDRGRTSLDLHLFDLCWLCDSEKGAEFDVGLLGEAFQSVRPFTFSSYIRFMDDIFPPKK